jgi:cytochrome P450
VEALAVIDLFSEAARRDPYPTYERLRASAPACRDPASGLWLVLDHEGVKRALSDPATFSSRYGPDWMIFADPPRHTKLRALVSKAFTPRSVAALEPRVRELCRELLDRAAGREEIDLVSDFSAPLPMRVIAEMLGIPAGDRPRFQRWADAVLAMSDTVAGPPAAARAAAEGFVAVTAEMAAYLGDLLAARRADPRDDLLARLAGAEVDGERLTHAELLGFFQLLLLAGSETTTNLISNAVLCLGEHPAQLARLRAEPGLLPSAIEEVLRYRSPLQWMYRVARRDVNLGGASVPAGALVLAVIGAANRDPSAFPDPGRFDIARSPNPHLAFGHGPHFCLGAPLARLEARVALADLLARTRAIEPAAATPWAPRPGSHVLGPARLTVRLTPARETLRPPHRQG